jgi:hypothetical protein
LNHIRDISSYRIKLKTVQKLHNIKTYIFLNNLYGLKKFKHIRDISSYRIKLKTVQKTHDIKTYIFLNTLYGLKNPKPYK